MRRGVGHLLERRVVQVQQRVAALVVAGVVRLTGDAAVDRGLRGRLDPLGAGEQAAGRDPGLDERAVVRAPVERRRLRREPLAREVVEEHRLDLVGPVRTHGAFARRVVAVVDEAHEVGRPDHVEVQHRRDPIALGRRKALDVVRRTEQAGLLRPEPDEAHVVARRDAGHLLGDLEDPRRSGAVVVDARPGADPVQMRADRDHVPGIAADALRDHVARGVRPRAPVHADVRRPARRAGFDAVRERLPDGGGASTGMS